jgi:demethylmenaquinone methyltransferase/2-methoxy-6-polyprenyl-1,4-benzoquinol methylase
MLNHLLSANVDRLWWRRTASRFRAILEDADTAILDICCGTGDMTMALLRRRPRNARPILAADFARAMLDRGRHKFLGRAVAALEADALHLPMRSGSLDLVVTAFGFRNLANYEAGLREFHRVLKPGGQLGILDFSEPGGLVGKAYALYFRHVLPAVGRLFSGPGRGNNAGPYNYLPASVGNFPPPQAMLGLMRTAGYEDCAWQPYTFGIAGLYTARRPLVV